MRGCHEHQLASYLDEHMYMERYGRTARQRFDSIIGDIATVKAGTQERGKERGTEVRCKVRRK